MNREQRRAEKKLRLANLIAVLDNGDVVPLNISKVSIIDKETSKPIFKESK